MALIPDPAKAGLPTLAGLLVGLAFATFIAPATTEGFLVLVLITIVLANVIAKLVRMARGRGRTSTGEPPES